MNNAKTNGLTLSQDNILTLRGQPMVKKIDTVYNSPLAEIEEWTYYNMKANTKESYCFRNGNLIKYKKEETV